MCTLGLLSWLYYNDTNDTYLTGFISTIKQESFKHGLALGSFARFDEWLLRTRYTYEYGMYGTHEVCNT